MFSKLLLISNLCKDLLENLIVVRQSTLHLLKSLDKDTWLQKGYANKSEVTVRALAYIIAGHELHHLQIIKERYLGSNAYPVRYLKKKSPIYRTFSLFVNSPHKIQTSPYKGTVAYPST